VVLAGIKYYRDNKNTCPLCLERAKGHHRAGGDASPEDRYVRRIKERDRWQWLLRRNFRRNFVPRKVAIAFRSGDKNWKSRDRQGGGQERGTKREKDRREKGKEGTTLVMVHEKTNSVILFGRRAKPSVWRHTFPLSLISSSIPSLLVTPPSPPTPIKEIRFRIDSRA